jgi:drug/metabolite transporter (DMT)-like permease
MNPARLRAYFLLLIVVVIWGIAPSVIKFVLGQLPPFLFLTYRFFITTIVLLPFYLASKNKGLKASTLPLLLFVSILGSTLNLGLLFYGTNLTTSLDSSLISATAPIFVIIAGILFLNEHETSREKLGVFITIVGTLIIAFQSFFELGTVATHSILGNTIIVFSNIAFAAYLFFSKKALRKGISPFTIVFWMFFIGLITTLPLAVNESGAGGLLPKLMSINLSAQLAVIYMALVSGALAYFLYQKAQKTIEASEAAVFNYLPPIVTAPVATLWLHEKLTIPYIIGSAVIAIGVILAELKKRRYN